MLMSVHLFLVAAAMLLPPELIQPLEYNTTLHLQWGHFLTVRGRDPPSTFAAESDARFKALRSTQCLVMHAQGLNFSSVSPLLSLRRDSASGIVIPRQRYSIKQIQQQ